MTLAEQLQGPHGRRTQRVLAIIKRHRMRMLPLGTKGAVRVVGRGLDITASRLVDLNEHDVVPPGVCEE